jgi:hypothetical protein
MIVKAPGRPFVDARMQNVALRRNVCPPSRREAQSLVNFGLKSEGCAISATLREIGTLAIRQIAHVAYRFAYRWISTGTRLRPSRWPRRLSS